MSRFDFDAPDCTCAYRRGIVARNMCGHTPPCPVYERWRKEVYGEDSESEAEEKPAAVIVPLSAKEVQVLEELSRLQELAPERVMIQALRLYQLVTVGGAKVVLPEDEPPKYGPSPLAAHVGQALADLEFERDLKKAAMGQGGEE
jgi:hypothetical protein